MNRVIVFRSDLLGRSETFIREQAHALVAWHPALVGYRLVGDGLELDDLDVRVVPTLATGRWERRWLRLCRRLEIAHAPTVHTLQKVGATLVHVHFGIDAVDIWPSVRKLGLPMLVTLHGYDINIHREWWQAGHGGGARKRYPRQLIRLARAPDVHFIAVSEAIRKRAIEYGIAPEKVTVRHIGVDINYFRPGGNPIAERSKRILFVGRLVENKGVDILIKAFAALKPSHPDAQLVLAGDGPLRADLENLASSLGVFPEFLGVLTREQVREQMYKSKVLCQPSKTISNGASEAFGMVILEAQACGTPVISSSRGGSIDGLLDGKTGFRFREDDTVTLKEKLEIVLCNNKLLAEMSEAAVHFVRRNFDLKMCTAQLETIYDSILNHGGLQP